MARASTTSLIMVEPATDSREVWFGQQIELLLPDLYGAALRLARDEMDVVGEAIASAWTHLATLERRATFRGWMFRILTNCFYSRRRVEKARGAEERFDEQPDEETGFSLFERLHQPVLLWWGNPERDFLNKLLREDLEAAVDGLPEPFRVVVVLADLEGLSYQEIAARVQIADIVVETSPSDACRSQPQLWAECIVGATTEADYIAQFERAGFQDIEVLRRLNYFSGSASEETRKIAGSFGAHAIVMRASKP